MEQGALWDVEAEEYHAFTEKFKPKKTTDDCYTPGHVYEAVAGWVAEEYGVDRENMVRPFWPGRDYQAETYPNGCVVVDNPPFSQIAKIIRFYCTNSVRFFLFAPAMTLFTAPEQPVCYLPLGISLTYKNGAEVSTSMVTNLDEARVRIVPALYRRLEAANQKTLAEIRKTVPKYTYPPEVLAAAICQKWAKWGQEVAFAPEDCIYINALDAQRKVGKNIFGGGFLLKPAAAAAAAAAGDEVWKLSEREKQLLGMEPEEKPNQMSLY